MLQISGEAQIIADGGDIGVRREGAVPLLEQLSPAKHAGVLRRRRVPQIYTRGHFIRRDRLLGAGAKSIF